jgi:hypothetical protein
MKSVILENLSMTINILSRPFLVLGNPNTKSIDISSQEASGTGRGKYKPCEFSRDFAFSHVVQRATNLSTSLFIFGQKK